MPDDLMTKLEEIQGVGFVTGTHDLKSIHDDLGTGITTITVAITAMQAVVLAAITAAQVAILAAIAAIAPLIAAVDHFVRWIKNRIERAKIIIWDKKD